VLALHGLGGSEAGGSEVTHSIIVTKRFSKARFHPRMRSPHTDASYTLATNKDRPRGRAHVCRV
jgi:hypothetical protein